MIYAAIAASRGNEHARSLDYAAAAREAHRVPTIDAAATAATVRALLALGRIADATALSARLEPFATSPVRLAEFDEIVRLAWAELKAATGEPSEGRAAVESAAAVIAERAATISDPLGRNQYLARPHLVAATQALAAR
jgi:hypothetical protein